MPNIRGGKGYKKGKGDNENEIVFLTKDKAEGQMIGRIVRALGDLNMSVFCEDNITRICKIAMGIKKKMRFFPGDIVLLSLRDCLLSKTDLEQGKRPDRGDILGKYHQAQFNELMKTENKYIFASMKVLTEIQQKLDEGKEKEAEELAGSAENDDLFDYSEEKEEKEEKEHHETKPIGWKEQRNIVRDVTYDEL